MRQLCETGVYDLAGETDLAQGRQGTDSRCHGANPTPCLLSLVCTYSTPWRSNNSISLYNLIEEVIIGTIWGHTIGTSQLTLIYFVYSEVSPQ
jgi:hypothetical protein